MKGAAALLAAGLAGCGTPGPAELRLVIAGCGAGSIRFLVLDGDGRCAALDPAADAAESPRTVVWADPQGTAAPRIPLDRGAALTIAAECLDADGVVRGWGCDDGGDDRWAIALSAVCAPADCADGCGACPTGAVPRPLPGLDRCVAVCEAVDPCAGVVCPPDQGCQDGGCVVEGPCAGVECTTGESCVGGDCVPDEQDADGDGVGAGLDCDDTDPEIVEGSTVACASGCGTGTSTCVGGSWEPCAITDPGGDCAPGDEERVACGRCGLQTRTCDATCRFADGPCEDEAGDCVPGATEACPDACGTRTCGDDCTWGACQTGCECQNLGVRACVGEDVCIDGGCGNGRSLYRCVTSGAHCTLEFQECGC